MLRFGAIEEGGGWEGWRGEGKEFEPEGFSFDNGEIIWHYCLIVFSANSKEFNRLILK